MQVGPAKQNERRFGDPRNAQNTLGALESEYVTLFAVWWIDANLTNPNKHGRVRFVLAGPYPDHRSIHTVSNQLLELVRAGSAVIVSRLEMLQRKQGHSHNPIALLGKDTCFATVQRTVAGHALLWPHLPVTKP